MRTNECSAVVRSGRLAKAHQLAQAAADVICCARLGVHSRSERHDDAVALLKKADPRAAKSLRVLLGMKRFAGYSYSRVTVEERLRAERAMNALLAAAEAA